MPETHDHQSNAEAARHYARLGLPIIPSNYPVTLPDLDSRGPRRWACSCGTGQCPTPARHAARIDHGTTTAAPAAVDATRLLAYLRGLTDQQLLALLADLPWSRLDTLLDAVQIRDHAWPRWRQPP